MTRLWPEGEPINVVQREGMPASFSWRGQMHDVAQITQHWRIDVDWWRGRRWRTYYKLTTNTGLLVVLFQDLTTHAWYLQRLYD